MQKSRETYIVENDQLVSPATIVAANGVEDTIAHDFWEKLLNEEREKATADDGKVKIMNHEWAIQDERVSLLHELPSTEYYDIVCHQRGHSRRKRRHNSLAALESEILGHIAKDGGVAFGKDGPHFNPERAVEGRDWDLVYRHGGRLKAGKVV